MHYAVFSVKWHLLCLGAERLANACFRKSIFVFEYVNSRNIWIVWGHSDSWPNWSQQMIRRVVKVSRVCVLPHAHTLLFSFGAHTVTQSKCCWSCRMALHTHAQLRAAMSNMIDFKYGPFKGTHTLLHLSLARLHPLAEHRQMHTRVFLWKVSCLFPSPLSETAHL